MVTIAHMFVLILISLIASARIVRMRPIRKTRLLHNPNYNLYNGLYRNPIIMQARWIQNNELIKNDQWQVSKIVKFKYYGKKKQLLFQVLKSKRRSQHTHKEKHKHKRKHKHKHLN